MALIYPDNMYTFWAVERGIGKEMVLLSGKHIFPEMPAVFIDDRTTVSHGQPYVKRGKCLVFFLSIFEPQNHGSVNMKGKIVTVGPCQLPDLSRLKS